MDHAADADGHALDADGDADGVADGDADGDAAAAVSPWTPWAPDAILNTARHMFFQARCGIFVALDARGVRAFVPFANREYENWWWPWVRLFNGRGDPVRTVHEYALAKAADLGEAPEAMVPLRHWWLNGGIACNVLPPDGSVWGTSFCAELRAMLEAAVQGAAAQGRPLPPAAFFLNKRDYPVLRVDRADPYVRFVGCPPADTWVPEAYAAHAPIFSFYTGPEVADVPMPTTEDWRAAQEEAATGKWSRVRAEHPLGARAPVAVFRGSATGAARVRLAQRVAALGPQDRALVDVGITGWNSYRDRVRLVPAGPGGPDRPEVHVTYEAHAARRPRAQFLPLEVQAARHRYIVYCDGHCAAGRYGTLMHTGSVILRVPSDQAGDCGHLWVFANLRGATCGDGPEVWAAADHVLLEPGGDNLEACVRWLNAQPLALVEQVARNAVARAPTVASITQFWQGWVRALHRAQGAFRAPAAPAGARAWWLGADPRYASIPLA